MYPDDREQQNNFTCDTDEGKRRIEMLEEERQRIVSELHDTSLQNITYFVHKIELASLYIDKDPARAKMELSIVSKGLHNVIEDMRSTIFNLRPMVFDDLGLKASFERLLYLLNQNHQYEMDIDIEDVSCETKSDTYFCITLYRVVQECLLNIRKHAEASEVLFHAKNVDDYYIIVIQDNGKGFSTQEVESKSCSHFGLSLIQEGIRLLDGTISVQSEVGEGTDEILSSYKFLTL